MSNLNCQTHKIGLRLFLLVVLLGLIMFIPVSAWAGNRTVYVPPPTGIDDTANLQTALDTCVVNGPKCTVQIDKGNYLTKQLVAYNFQGSFKGMGKGQTIITALPELPVNSWDLDQTIWYPPNTTDHTWPALIMFIDGDITISDMAVKVPSLQATQPYSLGTTLLAAIWVMGKSRTNAVIERIAVEGAGDMLGYFNLYNGVLWGGRFPKSSVYGDDYPFTGTVVLRASSFKTMASGGWFTSGITGVAKDSRVIIGGSPQAANVMEDTQFGIAVTNLENSVVEISHNRASGVLGGLAQLILSFMAIPNKPSFFNIHHNQVIAAPPYADGILLVDDPVSHLIYGLVHNNTVDVQNTCCGGITAVSTTRTTIVNNKISGTGGDGVGIWGGSYAAVLKNDVSNFTASPDLAQIVLDGMSTDSTVVCETPNDTVMNQGSNNKIIGCQLAVSTAQTSGRTAASKTLKQKALTVH